MLRTFGTSGLLGREVPHRWRTWGLKPVYAYPMLIIGSTCSQWSMHGSAGRWARQLAVCDLLDVRPVPMDSICGVRNRVSALIGIRRY